ncbi:MAG: type II secretion system protein N [Pseudomonadota bacterium]|nr:type II secretion system protein N [Pseudomonadota bacterium]
MIPPKKRLWLRLLILLLVLAGIAIAMAWSLPARFVYDRFGARVQPLRLQGIEGTLWSGKSAMASYAARPLGPVQWRLEPMALLWGSAHGELRLDGAPINAASGFHASARRIVLEHSTATFPASLMAPALDIPSLNLLGEVQVNMSDVVIEDGLIRSAIGSMTWNDVGVSGAAEARLGRLIVEFAPRVDGVVEGLVRDDGGPMQASGHFELRGLQFKAEIKLNARAGHEHIREALLYIGERSLDGGSVLRVEGVINKLY